jgi:CRP/FNR family cyclic AMP-dependent transcriptional regulator
MRRRRSPQENWHRICTCLRKRPRHARPSNANPTSAGRSPCLLRGVWPRGSNSYGEYVCWEGKPAHDCYYVEDSKVDLQKFAGDLGFVTVTTPGPGAWFGWSWLRPPHLWHLVGTRAASSCTLRALDAEALRRHCNDSPRFGYEVVRFFLQLVATRIHKTRRLLLEVWQAYLAGCWNRTKVARTRPLVADRTADCEATNNRASGLALW